jgi:hypothetical protein
MCLEDIPLNIHRVADLERLLVVNSKKIASSHRLTELLRAYLGEGDEYKRQQIALQILQGDTQIVHKE